MNATKEQDQHHPGPHRAMPRALIVAGCVFGAIAGFARSAAPVQDSFSSINLSATTGQNGVISLNGTNIASISSWSNDELTELVNVLDATTTVSLDALPFGGRCGTFWSLQNPSSPPLPFDSSGSDVWLLSDGSYLLNDVNFDYDAATTMSVAASSGRMAAMDSGIPLPGGGDSGSGGELPAYYTSTFIDYGTNLYLAQIAFNAGNLTGIISNTIADVRMEIQYTFDLCQPWQSANWYVYGSVVSNWTAWTFPAISSSNLFLRTVSSGLDEYGLPVAWEQRYGVTNIDPNALDSAGDGWSIYQKYYMNVDPSTWVTPAAPQELSAHYNASNATATLSWQPCLGSVSSYTIKKIDYEASSRTTTTSSCTTSSYPDDLSSDPKTDWRMWQLGQNDADEYNISYQVQANYTSGGSSAWSSLVYLQPPTLSGAIVPSQSGQEMLVVSGVSANTAIVRFMIRFEFYDASYTNVTYDLPYSNFNNNEYSIPQQWFTAVSNPNNIQLVSKIYG